MSRSSEETKSVNFQFGGFGIAILIIFAIILNNMKNEEEVTKFKFVDDTEGTYSYMLQVCCMIMFVVDMILFAIICIGFILLLISLFEYLCCSNEQNTSVPRASSPNKVNTLAVILRVRHNHTVEQKPFLKLHYLRKIII